MRRHTVAVILVLTGLAAAGVFAVTAPYSSVIMTCAFIGLVTSLFVALSWTPYAWHAWKTERAPISVLALLDFALMSYLGTIVTAARLWSGYLGLSLPPTTPLQRTIGVGAWFMVSAITSIRAYAWLQTLRRYPREEVARIVSKQMDHRLP